MFIPSILFATSLLGQTSVYRGVDHNTRVTIPRAEGSVHVDGNLSESVWNDAARLTGFSQYSPDDGREAGAATEVLVWYSSKAIYFGIRAQADPSSVRATLADRDRIDNDDWIQIYLSTFNDRRQATVLGVNPLGVQMDGSVIETGGGGGGFGGLAAGRHEPDLSPDFYFESKGRITSSGYEIELRIPFRSLRFQSSSTQDWGLHIIRRIQSTGHEDSWVPARRSAASFLGQAGTLVGLTNLERGLVMDMSPVVTTHTDGERTPDGWHYDGDRPELGANLRWGVTPNLTVNATVNPDFSQVEADATQFQIDPRQTLFYAEKRPFFLDGSEFFAVPNNLVYSRRIVDPLAAIKLTGKVSGTTVAALTAVDANAQSLDGSAHPTFNILRLQRDLGSDSRAGVLYTNRIDGPNTNHVIGADSHLVWRKLYSLDLQVAASRTSDGRDAFSGALWQTALRRNGRTFSSRYSLVANDADFRAAAGFIGRRGVVFGNVTHQLALHGRSGALIERWTGDVQLNGTWNDDDFTAAKPALERKLHFNNNFFLRGGWHTGFSTLIERYRFDPAPYSQYRLLDGGTIRPFAGETLPNLDFVLTLDTPRVRGLSVNIFYIWGRDENFLEWSSANIVYATAGLQWRPSNRLRADLDYNLQSFRRRTDDTYVAIRRAPRLKLEYQATRSIFFRYVGEYATSYQDALRDDSRSDLPIVFINDDGSYVVAGQSRRRNMRNDWLFSYQPSPGTVLFAGYGNAYTSPETVGGPRLERVRDGFFFKLAYVFRL
jgi:hypothetical protein